MPESLLFDSLSVIIPTYNRETVLAKALEGYLSQTSPHFIHELLVIDDGSTDGTESMVRGFISRSIFPIRYLRQPNKGPAAARNLGIREAESPLLLFTDSDIIPDRELVKRHVESHRSNPQITAAFLGYVTWPPEMKVSPFMRWYGESRLFFYDQLRPKCEASFHYFYTCNLSLKKEFVRSCGQFDEKFKTAAFEDIELGHRLSKRGLRLWYNAEATGYHYQIFSFKDACRKNLGNSMASELFYGTEAGRRILFERQEKRSRIGHPIARGLAAAIALVLSPLRLLVDSSLPLPALVYQLFFWDSTRQRRKRSQSPAPTASTGTTVSS
ncbi:MAG: glycosyltransferase family 2 protein [Candidatus Sulfotelmatobacter sp.]